MSSVLREDWFESRGIPANSSTLFFPVLEMIANPSSSLSLLFDSSLYSWVLLLTVVPGNSNYTTIPGDEQIHFLFKITVITPQQNQQLDEYYGIKKRSESVESFSQETKLQQNINLDNIRYGRAEKAPPVTSFALFGGAQATSFLSILKNKAIRQNDYETAGVMRVLDYLRPMIMQNNYHLGVIVMPKYSNASTLARRIKAGWKITLDFNAEQIASVLKMIIWHKGMPFDLHENNQLLDMMNDELVIIDYGRTSGLLEPGDNFLDSASKRRIYDEITGKYEPEFNRLEGEYSKNPSIDANSKLYQEICRYMNAVLAWVKEIEIRGNMRRFPKRYDSNPEDASKMTFIRKIMMLDPVTNCEVLYTAFKKLVEYNKVKNRGLTQHEISKFIKEGRIIAFERVEPVAFYCDIPQQIGPFQMETTEPRNSSVSSAQGVGHTSRYIDSSSHSATVINEGPPNQISTPSFSPDQVQGPVQGPVQDESSVSSMETDKHQTTDSFWKSFGGIRMGTKSKSYRNATPKYVKNRTKYLISKRKRKTRKTRKTKKQRKTRKTKK